MRGIVFALLLTFVGCQKNDPVPRFADTKSYLYSYKGLILNGFEKGTSAKSGLKMTCQVKISRVSQELHVLKVLSPQLEDFSGIWRKDPFTKASRVTERIGLCFTRVYTFEYKKGQIINIHAPEDVSVMCVNIIRGILNLLQLTIEESQNVYELQEVGIKGTCLTKYFIQKDKNKNKFTVSRTKDLQNCTAEVVKNIGMAYIRPCPTCPVITTNTRRTVTFNYNLKYTDTGALITHVESQEVHEMSPFNDLSSTTVMQAKQKLTLIETAANQERVPEFLLKNHGNLHYEFPEDLPQMATHLINTQSPELRIVETLEQLIHHNWLQVYKEIPAKFLELVELCRAATQEDLASVWKQFANRRPYRHWLLSAVTAAGTRSTFLFLKQGIHNEDFGILESTITLTLALHLTKTDKVTLEAAADLMTCPAIQKSPILRKLTYLGFGSMVNRHCSVSSQCSAEILQPLHDLAMAADVSHEEDVSLALKAIGNAGEPASLNYIKKFLPGFSLAAKSLPEKLQMNAVLALRKIARKKATTVRKMVFQIMANDTISPQVRMVACIVFFETKPSLLLVTAAASVAQRDSSLQFASFVTSHMKALAMGRIPQLEYLSAACNIALKMLSRRLEDLGFRYSKVFHSDTYILDWRVGALGRLYVMNSPRTLFQALIAKLRGFYARSAMDIVEVGLYLEGLTDFLKRQDLQFFQDLTYKKLKELAKLLQQWKEQPSEKPMVSGYLKLFSHEIVFGSLDGEFVRMVEKLLNRSAELLITLIRKGLMGTWTQPIMIGELRQIVPICVGFPLEFGLYSSGVVHAAAKLNGQISTPMTGDFKLDHLLENNMHLSAEMTSSVCTDLVAVMGINTPYFQNGLKLHVQFHTGLPVNFDVNIDMDKESLTFETIPVETETELFDLRAKLYAISRSVDVPNSAKIFQIFPEVESDVPDHSFKFSKEYDVVQQSMKYDFASKKFISNRKEQLQYMEGKILKPPAFYFELPALGYQTILTVKHCEAVFLKEMYLPKILEICEIKLTLAPVGAARTKLQLEVQAGSRAGSEIIQQWEGDAESSSSEERKAKRKKKKIQKTERNEQPQFLRHSKASSGLTTTLSTIQNDRKRTVFHLVLHDELHSITPAVQVFVSHLNGSKRMKICAEVSILDYQHAKGYLKWGQDCQDYRIEGNIAYGQFSGYPAMQIKVEWPSIPPQIEDVARELLTFIPGTAYMLGWSEVEQKNPPQEASAVVALVSPRTCDLILRLPHVTIYDTNIKFPVSLPVRQHTEALAVPSRAWDFVSYLPTLVAENLKGHCSVSEDSVTTFNGVNFQYIMPTSSYHVLAWDCSSEMKFLVIAKKVEQPSHLKIIHIKLANLDVDVLSSNGHVQMRINGTEIPEENLPYVSTSGGYIFINCDKNGFLLKAPENGIEKLFYDGNNLKIQVPFWMSGKNCGICGRYDAEYEQEYKMPNGNIAENAKSFAQSWVVPEDWVTAFAAIPQ
ncbi:vitellogenin-2 [Pogona vitticeps]